jgi:hypothetical protein
MPGVYGPITSLDQIEDAIEAVVRTWIDTYLGAVERTVHVATRSIKRPDPVTGYGIQTEARQLPEQSLPAIVIRSTGEINSPDQNGDGVISAEVALAVAAVVNSGTGRRATQRLTHRWATALALLIDQKAGLALAGLGQIVSPVLQDPAEIAPRDGQERWLGVAQVGFIVQVDALRSRYGGPFLPDPPEVPLPPDDQDYPAHVETNVTVTPIATTEKP